MTLKDNDNIKEWVDIELKKDFIQIDENEKNEHEIEENDKKFVIKDEIKETNDSDLKDYIII